MEKENLNNNVVPRATWDVVVRVMLLEMPTQVPQNQWAVLLERDGTAKLVNDTKPVSLLLI